MIQPGLVVSNTTPISNLIKVHHISLLHRIFGRGASLLLMDEIDGRRAAQHHDLKIAGTLGILLEAKRQAHVTELRPLVDDLERVGFRMSTSLKEHVLSMAGEA